MSTGAPPVICLLGPTAIGKSSLALELARQLNGEIISVDSVLVYRGMDIGTAKPSLQQRHDIPHHLIDILDPAQVYSTARFKDQALSLIEDIQNRDRTVVLTGGTMLYFKTLFSGLASLPDADLVIRKQLELQAREQGWAALHDELAEVDPVAAARIHPNDPQRIQRALEVYRISGESMSSLIERGQVQPDFRFVKLALLPQQRSDLHNTIRARYMTMLESGLIDETRALYEREDLSPDLPSVRAVGYRQVWAYLDGQLDYQAMIERAVIATRQLAKRQMTWLRSMQMDFQYLVDAEIPYHKVLNDLGTVVK
ncbi:MAG: tRNA (adenosine(37)-N6)-dimethylallyltransferase MiaA [Gammaproteobacteria bacterium]|nr:tRNA (adenosine(37)-N6)-dimethylallyltransferase MiaA [Gammaproteobacteria bacterium]